MDFDAFDSAIREIASCASCEDCEKGLRLALLKGELIRVPKPAHCVSVLSGTAWVSYGGADYLLCRGESMPIGAELRDPALLSAVGGSDLFVQLS